MTASIRTSLLALAMGLACAAPASAQSNFYAGKTIKMILNIGAGGATGIQARLFADYWKKHMPGNPDIIIEPDPGGAMMKGVFQVEKASRPDGLTVGWLVGVGGVSLLGPKATRISPAPFKGTVIAGIGSNLVVYARKGVGSGIKSPTDITKVGEVKLGGLRPTSPNDLVGRFSLQALGVKYDYVLGYKGGADVNAALLRKEVDVAVTPAASYLTRINRNTVKAGLGVPLWYFAVTGANGKIIHNEALEKAGVKPFREVYRAIKGKAPSGKAWKALQWIVNSQISWLVVAVPGTPQSRLKTLREGFWKTVADPAYRASVTKRTGLMPDFEMPARAAQALKASLHINKNLAGYMKGVIAAAQK